VLIEGLVGRLVERVERRNFEVWETAAAGRPCFMVAAALTRQEAVGVANERARLRPHPTLLVLDGRGNLVYRA
jgi:hypothetical protein